MLEFVDVARAVVSSAGEAGSGVKVDWLDWRLEEDLVLLMRRLMDTEVVQRSLYSQLPLIVVACKALGEVGRPGVRSSALLMSFASCVCHFAAVGPRTLVKDLRTSLVLAQRYCLLVTAS